MHIPNITKLVLALAITSALIGQSQAQFVTHPLTETETGNEPPIQENPAPAVTATPTPTPTTPPPAAAPLSSEEPETWQNSELEPKKFSTCSMRYSLKGFSLAYKQYDGIGQIKCRNGQQAQVTLSSKSIGFTIGKSEIEGEGHFSDVTDIKEIYGDYISLGNHFGFLKSVDQQILTRGEISLLLRGQGRGIDIGFTIGDLHIGPR